MANNIRIEIDPKVLARRVAELQSENAQLRELIGEAAEWVERYTGDLIYGDREHVVLLDRLRKASGEGV